MSLKAIMFDLDDTLLWDKRSVDTALEKTCQHIAEISGLDAERLQQNVRMEAPKIYAAYDTYAFAKKIGIGVFEAMWADFKEDPGEEFAAMRKMAPKYSRNVWETALAAQECMRTDLATEAAATFKQLRKKHPFLFADTLAVLNALKDRFQLLLLTNGSPDLQRLKLSLSPELKEFFQHTIISGDFGVGKPDTSIFQYALDQLGVAKEEAVMVGDNLKTDILGAQRIGMRSVWIKQRDKNMSEIHPTYVINELKELLPLVKNLV